MCPDYNPNFQLPTGVLAHNTGPDMSQYYTSLGVASSPTDRNTNNKWGTTDYIMFSALGVAVVGYFIFYYWQKREERGIKKRKQGHS